MAWQMAMRIYAETALFSEKSTFEREKKINTNLKKTENCQNIRTSEIYNWNKFWKLIFQLLLPPQPPSFCPHNHRKYRGIWKIKSPWPLRWWKWCQTCSAASASIVMAVWWNSWSWPHWSSCRCPCCSAQYQNRNSYSRPCNDDPRATPPENVIQLYIRVSVVLS